MGKLVKAKICTVEKYFVLFMVISFLGWAVETIGCSIEAGRYCDRGFISLPFCTIYGFTVFILYGLLGTPTDGGILLRRVNCRPVRMALYFFLSALIAVGAELLTAWFFDQVCGVSLWDYSGYRFNYKGYICLEFAFIWGALSLFGMRHLFIPVWRAVGNIPEKILFGVSGILAVVLVTEWIVQFAKII